MRHILKPVACILIVLCAFCMAWAETPPTLRIAVSSAPKTLDPALATDAAAARLLQLTNPALLTRNTQFQPVPLVAESCTPNPAHTQVTCTLRKGYRFHDKTPLTAHQVKGWLDFLKNTPRSPLAGSLADVQTISAQGQTLTFTLTKPNLSFLNTLADIPLAPTPKNDQLGDPRAGLGIYRLKTMDDTGTVVLAPSAMSHALMSLTFSSITDPTTRLLKLKQNEVDVVYNDLPPELLTWAKGQGWNVTGTPSTSYTYLALNFREEHLANIHIRKAISQAIHRVNLRTYLLGDMAAPAGTLLPMGHPAAYEAPEDPYNPQAASDALDDLGLVGDADSPRFNLTLLTSTDPLSQRVAQVIQSDLAKVGVSLELRPLEFGAFYQALKSGRFDMALASWTGILPPEFLIQTFHSEKSPPNGMNRGRVNIPVLDAALNQLATATNEPTQTAAAIEAQKIQAETLPYIPLYRRHHVMVTKPNLQHCTLPPDASYQGLFTCKRQ